MIEAYGVSLQYRDGTMALKNVQLKVDRGNLFILQAPVVRGKPAC